MSPLKGKILNSMNVTSGILRALVLEKYSGGLVIF